MDGVTFNNWLKANSTTITHALANQNETPLSAEDIAKYKQLHTNCPTTVITSDNDVYMSVKYVVDTKLKSIGDVYYGVLRGWKKVSCPVGFIIEHGFHSNPQTAKWFLTTKTFSKSQAVRLHY